ncbi:MAG: LPXTG cell wall anchor domain-containing protein [Microcella sp.]|uniref:glycine-rich domain-containing protein n=1 Tax=Microcella sp. TaxID=1913979 RepID=UPI0024CC29B1|nr:LPXTG cell wall anchor domain-containing protein [Microcella sp.]UYN83628.1 MAG: LPXTG cell wall anchor domain-containing protein [Microcella sp.]
MTAARKAASIAGIGTVGFALVGSAVPAFAASVAGCGDAPVGGDLTRIGDVCELDFSVSGSYSWTVPSGLSGLYAVVAGAGGGAEADSVSWGYAGSGGEVEYVDLSSQPAGSTAQIVVGAGGATSDGGAADGEDSSIDLGGVTTAAGGVSGSTYVQYCIADGNFSTYVGNGNGAGGPAGTAGDDCATTTAPGVAPATDTDSSGDAALAIFSTFTETLGAGGRVLVAPLALDPQPALDGTGRGADVQYVDPSSVPESNTAGGDGRVMLRYAAIDGADVDSELADTGGADATGAVALSGLLAAAGAAALVLSRRRAVLQRD